MRYCLRYLDGREAGKFSKLEASFYGWNISFLNSFSIVKRSKYIGSVISCA